MTLIKTMTARQNNPDEEVEGIQADNKLRQQALGELNRPKRAKTTLIKTKTAWHNERPFYEDL